MGTVNPLLIAIFNSYVTNTRGYNCVKPPQAQSDIKEIHLGIHVHPSSRAIFATSRFLVSFNPLKKNMKSTGSIAKPLILLDFIHISSIIFPSVPGIWSLSAYHLALGSIPGILPRPWPAAATSARLPRQRRCFQWTGRRLRRSMRTRWSTCPRSCGDELEMLYG